MTHTHTQTCAYTYTCPYGNLQAVEKGRQPHRGKTLGRWERESAPPEDKINYGSCYEIEVTVAHLVGSGKEDKDPNKHGLGSLPVLFTAQLPCVTRYLSHSLGNTLVKCCCCFFFTFYAVHLQCVVEGLNPVAASTKTLNQSIKQNLQVKKSPSFIIMKGSQCYCE